MKKKVFMAIGLCVLMCHLGSVSYADSIVTSKEDVSDKTSNSTLTTTSDNTVLGTSSSRGVESQKSDLPIDEESEGNGSEVESLSTSMTGRAFDFSSWTTTTSAVMNNFTYNGTNYTTSFGLSAPLFANTITNTTSGTNHYYSYAYGSASTSRLYVFINGVRTDVLNYSSYYSKVDTDGQKLLAGKVEVSGLEIVEVLKVTTDGKLSHILYVEKINTLVNTDSVYLVVGLDTMLDNDDHVPIISDGNSGSYISNSDITLWSEPISGVTQYVGNWRDDYKIPLYTPSAGHSQGDVLVDSKDTALAYLTDTHTYSTVGNKFEFSWQEQLYTDGVNPLVDVTINFESNGGASIADETLAPGTIPTKPADPTRPGFTFEGWYADSTFTTPFDFTQPVTVDTTVYAKWKINDVTISYESNGGTSIADETFAPGTIPTKPANPTRPGYTFDGWYVDSAFTTSFDFTQPVTVDTTVYAKWKKIASSGGSGSINTPSNTTSSSSVPPECKPTCETEPVKDKVNTQVKQEAGQTIVKRTGSNFSSNVAALVVLVTVSIAGTVVYSVKIEQLEATLNK